MTTVGSQDTTGPMTRDELKDLACLGFSADPVSYTHLRAHETVLDLVCRLLLEKKKQKIKKRKTIYFIETY